jgi:outer membrane protein assembly factor BamE (lipoprotein component of BamABCDE complex)
MLPAFDLFGKIDIFVFNQSLTMKKILAFVALAAFLSACSQYTCPTYSKKEAPKQNAPSEQRV